MTADCALGLLACLLACFLPSSFAYPQNAFVKQVLPSKACNMTGGKPLLDLGREAFLPEFISKSVACSLMCCVREAGVSGLGIAPSKE